eukprot:1804532-Rhodomonas_salina.1
MSMLCPRLPPALHAIAVSLLHSDASHPDCPTRLEAVADVMLSPEPSNVTIIDPVPTPLTLGPTHPPTTSTVRLSVTLHVLIPTVTSTLCVLPCPLASEHASEVCDIHEVASHDVPPTVPLVVCADNPILAPNSVTAMLPVIGPQLVACHGWLDASTPSHDHASVRLLALCPTLSDARQLPPVPLELRHRAAVSDVHSVPSQAVAPN